MLGTVKANYGNLKYCMRVELACAAAEIKQNLSQKMQHCRNHWQNVWTSELNGSCLKERWMNNETGTHWVWVSASFSLHCFFGEATHLLAPHRCFSEPRFLMSYFFCESSERLVEMFNRTKQHEFRTAFVWIMNELWMNERTRSNERMKTWTTKEDSPIWTIYALSRCLPLEVCLLHFIWGFLKWRYPNSWMVYSGKSFQMGWFRGTTILWNLHMISLLKLSFDIWFAS